MDNQQHQQKAKEEEEEYVDMSHRPHTHIGDGYNLPPTIKVFFYSFHFLRKNKHEMAKCYLS